IRDLTVTGVQTCALPIYIQFAGNSGAETFTISPGTVLTIGGKLSGASGIQLQKRNNGTLILNNDNSSFNGPITVSQGALEIQNEIGRASCRERVEIKVER